MSCLLIELPPELQLAVVDLLYLESGGLLRSLSRTCTFYHSLLAPYVYKNIDLRNDEKNGASVLALANSQHSKHVRELHYTGSFSAPDADMYGNALSDPKTVMPEVVLTVLSDLQRFPHLQTLSINFSFDSTWDGYYYDNLATEEVAFVEENVGWRALMAKTFAALEQDKRPCVKELQVRLVTKEVSAFSSTAFHGFLGTLERFKLSIHGKGDDAEWWCLNTVDGYLAFLSKLDRFFFDHLETVTDFRLEADETGPMGLGNGRHACLALNAGQMPLLKRVHLEMILVCPELVSFLVGHTLTLEHISLVDCFGDIFGLEESGIHWDVLFTALSKANPQRLSQLEIVPLDLPYKNPYDKEDDEGTEEIREVCRTLHDDPKRRLFAYAYLSESYGSLFGDYQANLTSFLRGDDQKAYDRLMQVIHANASR